MPIGFEGFENGNVEIGETRSFSEDGANFTVRIKDKRVTDKTMILTLTLLEVHSKPWHNMPLPCEIGSDFVVSESEGAMYAGHWNLT